MSEKMRKEEETYITCFSSVFQQTAELCYRCFGEGKKADFDSLCVEGHQSIHLQCSLLLKHLKREQRLEEWNLNAFSGSKAGCQPSGGEIKGSSSEANAYRHLFILHFKKLEKRRAMRPGGEGCELRSLCF